MHNKENSKIIFSARQKRDRRSQFFNTLKALLTMKQYNAELHYDEFDLESDRKTLRQLRAKQANRASRSRYCIFGSSIGDRS